MKIGYAKFVVICDIDEPENWVPWLSVRQDGVYIKTPSSEGYFTSNERASQTEHPTENLLEPVLAFPCSESDFLKFLIEQEMDDDDIKQNLNDLKKMTFKAEDGLDGGRMVAWRRAMINQWPDIKAFYKSEFTARQVIEYLKKHDNSGSIRQGSPNNQLWWKTETGEDGEVILKTVAQAIKDYKNEGLID